MYSSLNQRKPFFGSLHCCFSISERFRVPIKDHEMSCESESSEEQDQVQNGDDRKCPRHAAFNPENHCNPFQLQLEHLSITWWEEPDVSVGPFSWREDGLSPLNLPRSSLGCCFPPHKHTQTFPLKASTNGNDTNECARAPVQPGGCCCSLW